MTISDWRAPLNMFARFDVSYTDAAAHEVDHTVIRANVRLKQGIGVLANATMDIHYKDDDLCERINLPDDMEYAESIGIIVKFSMQSIPIFIAN